MSGVTADITATNDATSRPKSNSVAKTNTKDGGMIVRSVVLNPWPRRPDNSIAASVSPVSSKPRAESVPAANCGTKMTQITIAARANWRGAGGNFGNCLCALHSVGASKSRAKQTENQPSRENKCLMVSKLTGQRERPSHHVCPGSAQSMAQPSLGRNERRRVRASRATKAPLRRESGSVCLRNALRLGLRAEKYASGGCPDDGKERWGRN
jgi:hypothetical protein